MKIFSTKIIAILAIVLLLSACFGGRDSEEAGAETEGTELDLEVVAEAEIVIPKRELPKEMPKVIYVSKSQRECNSIFFSCPGGRNFFSDKSGCGCREGAGSNPVELGFGDLIRDHLARNLIKPKCGGGVLAEFVYIDEGAGKGPGFLSYNVWVIAREFCSNGEGANFSGPVALDIEVADYSRVLRGYEQVDAKDVATVKKVFTRKAAEWILAEENSARDQAIREIEGNMQGRLGNLQKQLAEAEIETETKAKTEGENKEEASTTQVENSAEDTTNVANDQEPKQGLEWGTETDG